MGGGGVDNGGGMGCNPKNKLKSGGAGKDLAILKEKHTFFWVVLTRVLEVLTILEGGTKGFHPLKKKGGRVLKKLLPCLEGGGGAQKDLDPRSSNFVVIL